MLMVLIIINVFNDANNDDDDVKDDVTVFNADGGDFFER
jgi:hypothetical protein